MWEEIIQPGTKIYVSGPDSALRYVSHVENIYQGVIYIAPPFLIRSGGPEAMRINRGDSLTVYIPGRQGLYRFNSTALILPEGPGGHAGISLPDHVGKTEMRSFIRVDKLLKVQYSFMPPEGEAPDLKKAEAANISAGGMKLVLPEFIEKGSEIKLQFVLPAGGSYSRIKAPSVVAWAGPADIPEENGMFFAGVKFCSIHRKQQDVIQQYVLKAFWFSVI
ncbi:MAG: flagellar brake protein [Bacillota bacterium]